MYFDRKTTHLSVSPTDLANFLACRHKTSLDLLVATAVLDKPDWSDPLAEALRARGEAHERAYVAALGVNGTRIVDLRETPRELRRERTLDAMRTGADVIVQASLADDHWLGYADVLFKTEVPSALGAWSYEVHDTKLARETRSGTVLQLCVYSDLVGAIQQRVPEWFRVVTPAAVETYRLDDFSAFYREVRARFLTDVDGLREVSSAEAAVTRTYPQPCDHCDVCRWYQRCHRQRRADDHLSLVAGLGRRHQTELESRDVRTLAALAGVSLPIPFKPKRGARETFTKLREQARLQLTQRTTGQPTFELLPVAKELGLALLPEPRSGDLFLDLEGDPLAGAGREYLFGLGRVDAGGAFSYTPFWAFTDGEERAAFDSVMTEIMTALAADPTIHIYHYAPYEPSAFRRLAGRYATREVDLDRLLRGGRFVDLYAVVRHAVRAGVERYSIKDLEPFYKFRRAIDLREAGDQRRLVELALETNDPAVISESVREAVAAYNRDDCHSTLALREWLEALRQQQVADGVEIPRPEPRNGDPAKTVLERDRIAAGLRDRLLTGVPVTADERSPEQHAKYLLAYLVDWHRREERVAWGEYHRVRGQSVEDLQDEPGALIGLQYVERVFTPAAGGRARLIVDRYTYPVQENDIKPGNELRLPTDQRFGTVADVDKAARTIDIKKDPELAGTHPAVVIAIRIIGADAQEKSLRRVAERVIETGLDDARGDRLVNDLLLSRAPRLRAAAFARPDDEPVTDFAVRAGRALDDSVLAIQGPPGSGKTFTGARMIAALVADGLKIGVVATGHKVIRKLLVDAGRAAKGQQMAIAHKPGEDQMAAAPDVVVSEPVENDQARAWLSMPGGRVLGGTAWMWARPEFAKSVDVLFVDEAGQMSLANVLAVAPAARSLVLLGDPQQLDQPQKGSHPDGVDVSALDHILGNHKTMPESRGIFLPTTWRLSAEICRFTSEVFYEGRLRAKAGLEHQRLTGAGALDGAGLLIRDVAHDECRNTSSEEVQVVADIVSRLLEPGVMWQDEQRREHPLTTNDILIVAPYNAHVARLQDRLPDCRVGTVDKFQGQEAPVVIYSMATSRPEDAPRGMEFLYSVNRLNVATSRARCACVLVASPHLFEPDCRTPQQMRLANALARYRELARPVS